MSHILTTRDGAVGIITIDRKERFNSLDVETARDLRKAGLSFARDASVRAVILRGAHGVFCSGADLKYIRAGGNAADLGYLKWRTDNPVFGSAGKGGHDGPSPASGERASSEREPERADIGYGEIFKQILEYIHSTISEIRRAPKPFVAAVDGVAAAGGFGVAMACDLVVASERATFEWAYGKTGLTGAESSTFFLPRLVGLRRAMELLFLNPRLDARKAVEYGLATAVYPSETFDADVLQLAHRLAEGPMEAMGIAKGLINDAAGMDRIDFHLDRELEQLARIADGADFAEGLTAFFEKRPPRFNAHDAALITQD
jgi:2-(1,2-epoxy-1,2-dihydrophenyl)acetyl-CoA isomerase